MHTQTSFFILKNISTLLRTSLFFLFLISTAIQAETTGEIATKAHLANINALLIFTAQEGLSSGRFNFTNVGVDMEIYHLPFTYHFDNEDKQIDYFLTGNIGYSRTFISRDIIIPPESRLNYDNHIRTYTTGLGGGVRYKASTDISLLGGAELIYSLSGASVKKPDDDIGDAIEDFFSQNYNDNFSYKLFVSAEYQPVIKQFKPYAKLNYKTYETKSSFDIQELASFKTQSSVATLELGIESPKLITKNLNYFTLEGYYNTNYLSGAIVQSVKFSDYSTLGLIAYWYTPEKPLWSERFFIEVSTVQSSGLDGYNFGIGFSINF